jgi:hypothetical protein
MPRFMTLSVAAAIAVTSINALADDAKKPNVSGKRDAAKLVKEKLVNQKFASVGFVGSDTAYYTSSPAQGRAADGHLKAGTKVRLVQKAGSYVRVVVEIEAYVPAESFQAFDKIGPQKAGSDKLTWQNKKVAPQTKAADKKVAGKKQPAEKKNEAIDKATLKKKLAAESKAAEKKVLDKKHHAKTKGESVDQAVAKKKAMGKAIEKKSVDNGDLKQKLLAKKQAAADKQVADKKAAAKQAPAIKAPVKTAPVKTAPPIKAPQKQGSK